jgi:hypothetical protein
VRLVLVVIQSRLSEHLCSSFSRADSCIA